MFNLIIVSISIAFLAIILTAGSSYIDFERVDNMGDVIKIESALTQVRAGITQHQVLYGDLPDAWSDITPTLIELPLLPEPFTWGPEGTAYTNTAGQMAVFFGGSLVESEFDLISSLQGKFASGKMEILESCTDTSGFTPANYPDDICVKFNLN